jgi:hypothetical protein
MQMIRHHNRSMKLKASPVIMQTVTEHGVPGFRRKRVSFAPAKRYEQRSSCFLIVGQLPPVFVLPIERRVGHRLTLTNEQFAMVRTLRGGTSSNSRFGGVSAHTRHCTVNLRSLSVFFSIWRNYTIGLKLIHATRSTFDGTTNRA